MSAKTYGSSVVIGGTGMLAEATRWLIARSETTLVVARRASHFCSDADHLIAVDADWNRPSFSNLVVGALKTVESPEIALVWLHEPNRALHWLLPLFQTARLVLLLGSMDGRPDDLEVGENACTVRLGSIQTPSGRRWLRDDEISGGAIASIGDGRSRVVGDLLPP